MESGPVFLFNLCPCFEQPYFIHSLFIAGVNKYIFVHMYAVSLAITFTHSPIH